MPKDLLHGVTLCLSCLAGACVDVGAIATVRGELELTASDWSGVQQDLQRLPRRPRLRLAYPAGIATAEQAVLLFPGTPEQSWVDDLSRSPVLAQHQALLIDSRLDFEPDATTLVPDAALDGDAPYVLAVPSWARSRRGASLNKDGQPRLFALRTAPDADAGARVVASWPADAASGVGTNLKHAVIALDGDVEGAADGFWLEGPDGLLVRTAVSNEPCGELLPAPAARRCIRLTPARSLAPNARHELVVGESALDAHGAPVGAWRAAFRTGESADHAAPSLLSSDCGVDEQAVGSVCALVDDTSIRVRTRSDEAVIAVLRCNGRALRAIASQGELELRLADLQPATAFRLELDVEDAAGNAASHGFALRTEPPLATLSITEVLADPLGPEPHQELVEVFNYGRQGIELSDFTLSDRPDARGSPIRESHHLDAQARALLVADGFDPKQGRDAAPPPGTTLVHIGRALTGSGLSNAGEPLFLRDGQARRISAAPATPRPRPGICLVRITADMRDGSDGSFAYADEAGCTPGR